MRRDEQGPDPKKVTEYTIKLHNSYKFDTIAQLEVSIDKLEQEARKYQFKPYQKGARINVLARYRQKLYAMEEAATPAQTPSQQHLPGQPQAAPGTVPVSGRGSPKPKFYHELVRPGVPFQPVSGRATGTQSHVRRQ